MQESSRAKAAANWGSPGARQGHSTVRMAAAHAVEELVVVKPRRRRAQAAAEVLLRHAVFVTHKAQGFRLGFGEIFPMHRQVVAAHRLQEHHLQVQIVVGYHFGEHGIVLAEIQQLLLPFIGISQGASCFCP